MAKSLTAKVDAELDQVNTEKARQRAKEKAIEKCLKDKVFTIVSKVTDEDDMDQILDLCTL